MLKTEVIRITKDFRINVPKEFIEIMGMKPDSFVILELDTETKALAASKAKVIKDP